ncbi:N-acyl-D-amino-acid deacylase family protein [Mycobacterium sp. smrl_JER01]|uniref:N-acyl-D-amino-acid deacylase family protein n=1 Tax=Mycobacterium sp. smrl_JER01 TaxID=3402633 RepID=UPI003AC3D773
MFDVVIRGGRWFDGTGSGSAVRDLGIRDGRVVAVSESPLEVGEASTVIDAGGKWVMPGIIDIHTHYDAEVLAAPSLSESVRHGVTTILMGSCSLSTVHVDAVEAADLFGRVEAIPHDSVVSIVSEHKDWDSAGQYAAALESLPLGPNVAAFIGHSDVRTAVMGLDRATRKDVRPSAAELALMESMVTEALDEGFVGMSSQQLLFDKVDGDVARSRTLPSTYARARELARLRGLVRSYGRVLQSAPDITHPWDVVLQALRSSRLGRGAALKTSLLAAADAKSLPMASAYFRTLARVANALGGDFRFQHLPVPFEVYADGIDLVIFEEFGSGAAALHLKEEVERNELLADEGYRRWFRKNYDAKFGPRAWHRDFFDAEIVACPDESVVGLSFGAVGQRRGVHPVDAYLDLVLEHGKKLRWRTTISNHRPQVLRKFAQDKGVQMGFSDAGAHLRNMAFYNCGLRLLRHVRDAQRRGQPFMSVEQAVHRLTGELADWYGLDAGHLRVGDWADVLVVDPERLDRSLDDYHEAPVEAYGGLSRMVNRNDATVSAVLVAGQVVFRDGQPTEVLGSRRTGSFLRADRPRSPLPAPVATGGAA